MRLSFAELVRVLRNASYYLNPALAAFACLPLPKLLSYPTAAAVFAVASIGVVTGLWYSRRPTSLRRLLLFADGTFLSMAVLLVIVNARVVSTTSINGWLTDYRYGIGLLFAIAFIAILFPWRIWRRRRALVETMMTDGGILAEDVYNGLLAFDPKGNWTQARVTQATVVASGPFIIAGIAGPDWFQYLLFGGFLLMVVVAAVAASTAIARRVYLLSHFPRDLYIIDPAVQKESVFWRRRMSDNYRSLSRLAKAGLYAELVVYVFFALMVVLGGGSAWTPVIAIGIWSVGLLLILVDNKHDHPRVRSTFLGWMFVHMPLVFLGSFILISLLTRLFKS